MVLYEAKLDQYKQRYDANGVKLPQIIAKRWCFQKKKSGKVAKNPTKNAVSAWIKFVQL